MLLDDCTRAPHPSYEESAPQYENDDLDARKKAMNALPIDSACSFV